MPSGLKGTMTIVQYGKSFECFYAANRNRLRVTCEFGSKTKPLNKLPAKVQSTQLLTELVASHTK
jgi:hypothetical protein